METREYRTEDKSAWGAGPWQDEPDKKQWRDEATGLPCLAVRGPGGHWCGYVGVSPGHPWHGVGYSGCTEKPVCGESWCGHAPESHIEVHGGLTFADACVEMTEEAWRERREQLVKDEKEAERYPKGDAARRIKRWGEASKTFETWKTRAQATTVCHIAGDNEPDDVWWFGFDCAHLGDLSPRHAADGHRMSFGDDETYKTLRYVESQCAALAEQLAKATES